MVILGLSHVRSVAIFCVSSVGWLVGWLVDSFDVVSAHYLSFPKAAGLMCCQTSCIIPPETYKVLIVFQKWDIKHAVSKCTICLPVTHRRLTPCIIKQLKRRSNIWKTFSINIDNLFIQSLVLRISSTNQFTRVQCYIFVIFNELTNKNIWFASRQYTVPVYPKCRASTRRYGYPKHARSLGYPPFCWTLTWIFPTERVNSHQWLIADRQIHRPNDNPLSLPLESLSESISKGLRYIYFGDYVIHNRWIYVMFHVWIYLYIRWIYGFMMRCFILEYMDISVEYVDISWDVSCLIICIYPLNIWIYHEMFHVCGLHVPRAIS